MKTVFISSTFKDMQAERDAIKKITLPTVNTAARSHNDEFDFCDLRWGVDTAEMETNEGSKKVLEVCLDEIDRCQPPMVVMLGYRYGWIPNSKLIENAAKAKEMQLEDLQKSVTALEIEYGAFKNCRTLYYFREIEGQAPEDYQSEDKEHAEKLSALKQLIYEKSGGNIKTYKLKWNGNCFDGTEDFAKMLAEDIKAMLMDEWLENDKLSPLQREMRVHEKFVSDKKDVFSARSREAEELKQRILEQPVTIMKGAVGSGKSTLFSKLATELQKTEWKVLSFISGLTNQSNDAQDIIENIIEFLETELNVSEHYRDEKDRQTGENIRHTPEQWREKLAEMCARYTQEKHKKLLIMIDAVDQLSQNDQRDELHFIPFNVGENIHFAMTSTLDFDTRSMDFYTLKDIDEDDKKEVISGTLKRVHKQLSKKVVDKIVSMKASKNPLYISLLVQRLVLMDEDDFKIIRKLGDGMPAIEKHQINIISGCPDDLDEMSAELLRVAAKGIDEKLVAKAGEYLAVSRYGLRKSDLAELLGEDWTEVKFSHFINFMYDCFMVRDDGRYDFTHKSIRAGFLKKCDREKLNLEIFSHLKVLPDNDPVRIAEVVYHAIQADDKHFFIDYIIKNYHLETVAHINQAALDIHKQCMEDKGKWICDILTDYNLFEMDDRMTNFVHFVNLELNRCFTGNIIELNIQISILLSSVEFSEYLDNNIQTDNSKNNLSISYNSLACVYKNLVGKDNFDKALEFYKKSLDIREQLEQKNGTAESKRDLALSYGYIAQICESMNCIQTALEFHLKSSDIFEKLVISTGLHKNIRDLAVCYSKTAEILEKLGGRENFQTAFGLHEISCNLFEELQKDLETNESEKDLLHAYNCLAGIYEKRGSKEDLFKSLKIYEKGLVLSEKLEKTTNTNESKRNLSISYERIAGIYKKFGGKENLLKALELYNKDLAICEQLERINDTYESKKDLAAVYLYIGEIYEKFGEKNHLRQALNWYTKSSNMLEKLAETWGGIEITRNLFVSYNKLAGIYKALDGRANLEKALELYQKCLTAFEALALFSVTMQSKIDLSVSYNKLADVYERLGGTDNLIKSLKLYQKSLNIFKNLVKSENSIKAYDGLVVILYKIAMHPYTDKKDKKELLIQAVQIAKMLYDNLPNEKYETFLMMFYKELIGMGE